MSTQRRLWWDWVDAQADLSLRWAHYHYVGFVMRRLKLILICWLQVVHHLTIWTLPLKIQMRSRSLFPDFLVWWVLLLQDLLSLYEAMLVLVLIPWPCSVVLIGGLRLCHWVPAVENKAFVMGFTSLFFRQSAETWNMNFQTLITWCQKKQIPWYLSFVYASNLNLPVWSEVNFRSSQYYFHFIIGNLTHRPSYTSQNYFPFSTYFFLLVFFDYLEYLWTHSKYSDSMSVPCVFSTVRKCSL